jgi:dihydropyrimidinase
MAEYDLLVVNGLVVTDQEAGQFDIAIKNGKISKVSPKGSFGSLAAKRTIDARGGMVMVSLLSALVS